MIEWVLIITMNIVTETGTIRDVQVDIVDGFSSEEYCDQAAKIISHQLIRQVTNHRKKQGFGNTHKYEPNIWAECKKIKK